MVYKKFKDIELSVLGMGNMRLPGKHLIGFAIDRKKAGEMIDYCMANGVNYYDTAYIYHGGDSEKFLGEAMKKYPRDSFYLATKFYNGIPGANHKKMFVEQLRRLQTDYIDFYLIHSVMDSNANKYINSGAIEYFMEQKKQGKIKYLGFSFHGSLKCLEKFSDYANWDFAQIQMNYFDCMYGTAKEQYDILTRKNIPVMVMESVRGGKLSDLKAKANTMLKAREPERSIASWAFRYLMAYPNVQVMLSGMSTLEQVKDNIATCSEGKALSEEEIKYLQTACDVFHRGVAVPCTGCRYCCEGCPKGINIPQVMSLYNIYKTEGKAAFIEEYRKEPLQVDCLNCKNCEKHCPQSIQVAGIVRDVMKMLEEA